MVRQRARKGTIAALVVAGALLLSACKPPQSMETLSGPVTSGAVTIMVPHDETCPRGDDDQHGTRWKWTARLQAADPQEWLRIDSCEASWSALGGAPIDGGPFVIYTADGEVHGTAKGVVEFDAERNRFVFTLTVTSGKGVYASTASGQLTYWGCTTDRWVDGVLSRDVLAGGLVVGGVPAGGFTYPRICTYP